MNIKILDSWLREYVKTKATPQQLAEKLSLSSVSVERIEKFKNDLVYDIEVTTNRPELMSVIGLARETAAVLNQNNIPATFSFSNPSLPSTPSNPSAKLSIHNDPHLVNRICAVVMDVTTKPSPQHIQDRLESTDIRSLNNLIDITNYVMRAIGHPTHVFDYDRLTKKTITIRESKPNEEITTLDKKTYKLPGGDIVAEANGTIIDLPGIMGLANSAVTTDTKRIVFFINNDEPTHVRKTSMTLGIRTEAAVLNEKGIDPELAMDALLYGIKLFEELANGQIVSPIIDIYPNKKKQQTISVSEEQINSVIGIQIPLKKSADILESLGFEVTISAGSSLQLDPKRFEAGYKPAPATIVATPPSFRADDIAIPEDLIEEIARVYGYHNIPNKLPSLAETQLVQLEKNDLYWEDRVKDALKYWGFTEVYTYPMVSEAMYEGPIEDAVTIQNPLSEDMVYMRQTLVPSLLKIIQENKTHDSIKIFEIANVYSKRKQSLPEQTIKLAGVIKKPASNAAGAKLFFIVKGIIEQLLADLGIKQLTWKPLEKGGVGASIYIRGLPLLLGEGRGEVGDKKDVFLGDIEVLDNNLIDFELNFETIINHATLKKTYKPASKYPPVVEDLALIAPSNVPTGDIMELIKKQHPLITEVSLLDKYQDTRTFHIVYQSYTKNLTNEEVGKIRAKILKVLQDKLNARLKE